MRYLAAALVFAVTAPLSACYVGNTPPPSRRAPDPAADAATPDPEADAATMPSEDDAAIADPPLCERDEDCGEDGRCARETGFARCELVRPAPPADAGRPVDCRALCEGRVCGIVDSPECGDVNCGECANGSYCGVNGVRCEVDPRSLDWYAVTVVAARVDRCDTSWDQCPHGGGPLCSPSRPDPFVRINGVVTAPGGNTCATRYDVEVGIRSAPDLTAGLDFVLEDDDAVIANVRTGDVICRGRLAPTAEQLAAGQPVEVPCAGGAVVFSFARRVPR